MAALFQYSAQFCRLKILTQNNSFIYIIPDLGIEISCDLKWRKHINNIVLGRLGMLKRVLKTADTRTRQFAYVALVRPILEYGTLT